jgi:hypothetical protein
MLMNANDTSRSMAKAKDALKPKGKKEEEGCDVLKSAPGPAKFSKMKGLVASIMVVGTLATATANLRCGSTFKNENNNDSSVSQDASGLQDSAVSLDASVMDANVPLDGAIDGSVLDASVDAGPQMQCNGASAQSAVNAIIPIDDASTIGGYNFRYSSPYDQMNLKLDIGCASDGVQLTSQDFSVFDKVERVIPATDGMRIRVTIASWNTENVYGSFIVDATPLSQK